MPDVADLLSLSLNAGYRYYAKNLPKKTGSLIYRDPVYMAEAAKRRQQAVVDANGTATRSCGSASGAANFVELGIL